MPNTIGYLFSITSRSVDSGNAVQGLLIKPLEVLGFWGFSILVLSPVISWAIFRLLLKQPIATCSTTYWPLAVWLFGLSTLGLSLVALLSTALYYWNILAYLLLLPLLPDFFARHRQLFKIAQGLGCFVAMMLAINYCVLPLSALMGPEGDQDGRMLFGWEKIGSIIAATAQDMGAETLLLTTDYRSASILAYTLDNPDILAVSSRRDQFDVWSQSKKLAGKNAVVLADDWYPMTPAFKAQFERLSEPVTVPIQRWQVWIKNYYLYQGYSFHP